MEILFVALGGVFLGIAAHYALPRRSSYGVAVLPGIALAVSSLAWVGLTALGWAWDAGWIWLLSLALAAAASVAAGIALGHARHSADERFLHEAGLVN